MTLKSPKPKPENAGKCFELAAKHCMTKLGDYTIARVTTNGKKFLHAYVETPSKIYDRSMIIILTRMNMKNNFIPNH